MISAADEGALDQLLAACKVTGRKDVSLGDVPTRPALPKGFDKAGAEPLLAQGVRKLSELQEQLYVASSWSVLLVFQATDAAGKDGTIKHVMSGVNPQGIHVTSFKPPGPEDLAHDFLWRVARALPARGMIGIFNRSHYEEVIVPRVHRDVLAAQHLPAGLAEAPGFWAGRLDDIGAFERHLAREGTLIVKFFLHISPEEQKKRLLARLDDPAKLWKFDPGDVVERDYRVQTIEAYEAAIAATAADHAPWFIIPADRKWLMRLLVVRAINDAIGGLKLEPPRPSPERLARFAEARQRLLAQP